ncbi:MAG: SEL1-like repeat protein, partial [Pseudomonadota bacterium]
DVMEAARTAAEQVLAQANLGGAGAPEIARLSDDLKALEALARESDGRNERTFEAIHDTLLKVVDHLSDLDRGAGATPASASTPHVEASTPVVPTLPPVAKTDPQTLPVAEDPFPSLGDDFSAPEPAIPPQSGLNAVPPTGRLPVDDAPSIDGSSENAAAKNLTPAQAAASAAIAAMSKSQDDATVDAGQGEPAKKTIIQAMTDRFKKGEQLPGDGSADGAIEPDVPLEPGTAQAEVAEIIARVRRDRENGGAAPDVAAPSVGAPLEDASASKSDFIAAARRAAQAAATDAQTAELRAAAKKKGLKSGVAEILSSKRRPILIGAAAILMALLALPFVRGLIGGNEVAVAPTPPPAIEQALESDSLPQTIAPPEALEAPTELAEAENQPRIIGEDESAAAAAAGDSDGVDTPVIADVQQADIPVSEEVTAAVPDTAGTPAMQGAARERDPKAMFLVGDYFAARAQTEAAADADAYNVDALTWYTKSAEAGYAPAQQRLGSLYEKGVGTTRDLQIAKSWYQLAAEQGNAPAMHNLGVLYANGVDGQPDLIQAVTWFEQAALYGVRDSQYNLGVMAVRGDGMEPSLAQSYKWFALAAANGDADAASKRDTVAERMDPASLQQAKDDVALWRARDPEPEANIVDVPEAWQTDQMRTSATPAAEPIDMAKAVRNIQAILNSNGYDAGPVDGLMGAKTTNAIKAFQQANGMEATGEVNEELVRKLLALAA